MARRGRRQARDPQWRPRGTVSRRNRPRRACRLTAAIGAMARNALPSTFVRRHDVRPEPPFTHDRAPRIGVLLVNLGTPDAPTPSAVRRYLAEFLSDPRVVEIPPLVWKPILHGVILRVRPAQSAQKYAAIWTKDGSPLLVHSVRQQHAAAWATSGSG